MKILILLLSCSFLFACNKKSSPDSSQYKWLKENPPSPPAEKFSMDSPAYLIRGARIMTAAGQVYEKANLLMEKGLIKKISQEDIPAHENTTIINAEGLTLTPGLIDVHSHMGVYPSPSVDAHEDGNEMSRPVTADIWAEHAFWPQDPDLWRALSGGVTTIQVLPGSGNLFGGRSFTAKLIPKLSAREMRFDGAPQGLKMACGENPKRVYKDKGIMSRMGNMAGYRKAFQEAIEYLREWETVEEGKNSKLPKRNLVSETLAKVLKGEILIHFHCYRADDISAILDLANEFNFKIRTIHHGLEAYKIAPRLARDKVSVATWADWWGFKAEAFDGIPYNIALLEKAGAKAIVHSDSAVDVRYLNVEAAKALSSAKKLGLDFSEDQALAWITKNPAWALGIDKKVGTLEEGKMADIVIWDGSPFSIFTKTKTIFINGKIVFDRDKKIRPRSDFEVGFLDQAFNDGRDFTPPATTQKIAWPVKSKQASSKYSQNFFIENVTAFINEKWQKNTSVVIKDGQISQINPQSPPVNLKKINGQGKFLTPGFIESSSSLGLFEISLDSRAQDLGSGTLDPTPDYKAATALNRHNIRIPISRAEGVTTSLAHIMGGMAAGFGVAFDLSSEELPLDQSIALYGNLERRSEKRNRTAIKSQLENLVRESILFQKNKSAFFKGQTYTFENKFRHLKAMEAVLKGQKPWVLKANRADDILQIIHLKELAKKSGFSIRFIISGASESWLVAKKLVEHKIPVIISPTAQTPTSFDKTKARFDLAAVLDQRGVEYIINDNNDNGAARIRQEAGFAVKYGLSPEKALTAITKTPAKVFGLKRGQIKNGADANLVLWSASPLEPSSWAEKIWIKGSEMELSTRQIGLARKYLEKQ